MVGEENDMPGTDLLPFAVIAADIEGFTSHLPRGQADLRADFLDLFGTACAEAGVVLEPAGLSDRGDGGFALVGTGTARARLVSEIPRRLSMGLRRRNSGRDARHRMRLRLVLHHGLARPHRGDWLGPAVNTACRLADADAGRRLLEESPEADLVLLLSGDMYRDTVALGEEDLDPADFAPGVIPDGARGAGIAFWATMVGRRWLRPAPAALAAAGMGSAGAGSAETGSAETGPGAPPPPHGGAEAPGRSPAPPGSDAGGGEAREKRYSDRNSGAVAMGRDSLAINGDVHGPLTFGSR